MNSKDKHDFSSNEPDHNATPSSRLHSNLLDLTNSQRVYYIDKVPLFQISAQMWPSMKEKKSLDLPQQGLLLSAGFC